MACLKGIGERAACRQKRFDITASQEDPSRPIFQYLRLFAGRPRSVSTPEIRPGRDSGKPRTPPDVPMCLFVQGAREKMKFRLQTLRALLSDEAPQDGQGAVPIVRIAQAKLGKEKPFAWAHPHGRRQSSIARFPAASGSAPSKERRGKKTLGKVLPRPSGCRWQPGVVTRAGEMPESENACLGLDAFRRARAIIIDLQGNDA